MRKRLDVRLPEALHVQLRATAAAQDRTVTWVVERALEAALGGSSGHEAGAAKRSPASPRMPVATAPKRVGDDHPATCRCEICKFERSKG